MSKYNLDHMSEYNLKIELLKQKIRYYTATADYYTRKNKYEYLTYSELKDLERELED